MAELKLLLHVAQVERWEVAATNAINFFKSRQEGDNLQVCMVANADAVTICGQCNRPVFDKLKQIVLDGGEIFLCENALQKFEIPSTRIAEVFKTTPSGIRKLVELQQNGWIYVRP